MGAGVVGSQFRHVDIMVQGPTGKRDYSLWTFRSKVKNILQQAGIKANVHDKILPAGGTLTAANKVVVQEAIPVWVKTAHRRIHVWTTQYRVQAVLDAAKVKLAPLDLVRPAFTAKITGSTTINVIRRKLVTKQVTEEIPFQVVHRADAGMNHGTSKIAVKGRDGKRVKTLEAMMVNGRVAWTKTMKSRVAVGPTTEVIDYGTAQPVNRGASVPQFTRSIAMLSTAYWPDPAWSNGYTKLGLKAQYGVVAVDPSVIPLGTHLYIPGYGFAIAADTGSAIIGDRIDLCFNTGVQAEGWGVRPVTVYIVGS
ncbi:DUF348 domain-containing protein [Sulfobacillus sp. DSM 109850]|uniref:DUF348 domain-containing protein n=2 Tax=Sulfobacillus harzensis TaxID=2729629 RepID=A0A7Y0Q3V1_9FIRM|nr:DUF348 domain-containing protein [Sulfobacillus harzensis]